MGNCAQEVPDQLYTVIVDDEQEEQGVQTHLALLGLGNRLERLGRLVRRVDLGLDLAELVERAGRLAAERLLQRPLGGREDAVDVGRAAVRERRRGCRSE